MNPDVVLAPAASAPFQAAVTLAPLLASSALQGWLTVWPLPALLALPRTRACPDRPAAGGELTSDAFAPIQSYDD